MKKNITFSKSGVIGLKSSEKSIAAKILEMLFAGIAVRNASHGSYSLNGLSDISENEMVAIYNKKEAIYNLDVPQLLNNEEVRTIVPCEKEVGVRLKNRPLNGNLTFADSGVEVLKFSKKQLLDTINEKEIMPVVGLDGTFKECKKLRVVYPMNITGVDEIAADTFKGCTALQELRLYGLATPLDISSSPLLSYGSLLYMVTNCKNSDSVSIVVSADTFKYLVAMELPNENIGGTAGQWLALFEDAGAKGINFDTPGCFAYVMDNTLCMNRSVVDEDVLNIDENFSCSVSGGVLCFQ